MKSKIKKIIACCLSVLLVGSAVAVVGVGSEGFKNWNLSAWFDNTFDDVKIENAEFEYDGKIKVLNIDVPEGATFVTTITNEEGEEVVECIDVGKYFWKIDVTIDGKSKTYNATLTIVKTVLEEVESNGVDLKLVKVYRASSGEVSKSFNYTITPATADTLDINANLEWDSDNGSSVDDNSFSSNDINDYLSVSVNSSEKLITLTCKQAFGKQAVLKVSAVSDSSKNAKVTINYDSKLLTAGSVSVNEGTINDGSKITYTAKSPVYSVGSTGSKMPSENLSKSISCSTLNSALTSSLSSFISTNSLAPGFQLLYKGAYYDVGDDTDETNLVSKMVENVNAYITTLFDSNFSQSSFLNIFKFTLMLDNLNLGENTLYNTTVKNLSYTVKVSAYGLSDTGSIQFSVPEKVTSLTLGETNIVF